MGIERTHVTKKVKRPIPSLAPISRRRTISGAAAFSLAAVLPGLCLEADWRPARAVRVVVPLAPGGSVDVMARLLAAHLQTAWGQSVWVENRSGGGGTTGVADVVNQPGDGHTILVSNPGPTAIAYSIFANLPYRSDQLQPVSNLFRIPNIVSAHPSTGIKSISELIDFLRANPEKLNYGSPGIGTTPHLAGAWFLQLTGLQMTHVPFRGAAPALQAALAGDVQILFDNLYPSLPQILDGKLIGLAVTTPERSAFLPSLPSMREVGPGLSSFDVSSWCGVFLPKGAPPQTVQAFNRQIGLLLEREEVRKQLAAMGARPDYGTAELFGSFLQAENAKFAAIIRQGNLRMDVN
jgi:tripartite-type tricarboxylate transporter receptor subunit TctC